MRPLLIIQHNLLPGRPERLRTAARSNIVKTWTTKTKTPCISLFSLSLCLLLQSQAAALSDPTRATIEADWQRQEQVTRQQRADTPQALAAALERSALMIADMRKLGATTAAATAETALAAIIQQQQALTRVGTTPGEAWLQLYLQARWATRTLAFSNPRLDFDELLFVKRHWPSYGHQCAHRVGEAQTPGATLSILKGLHPGGEVRELLSGEFTRGGIGRPDLSFDGKRVVFPFAAPRKTGDMTYHLGVPGQRGGRCVMYDIYEVDVAGGAPRRLTTSPDTEDTEPCYLPDGRIAFTSSRAGRLVQCGDWALACGIYSMNREGGEVRQITEPKEGEFYPSIMEDGRIMYTRWDYMMKGYNVIQQLWAVNPDGTRAQLAYGDHYQFSQGPITFFEARQIPDSSKVIATGAAHHNAGVGPIVIVDLTKNRGGPDSMLNVTPELGYPEMNGRIYNETGGKEHRNMSNVNSAHGWYSSPYPLSENHFLVTYAFDRNHNAAAGYALYLQDVHGNRDLIYRATGTSCYSPIPLRNRKRPLALPSTVDNTKDTGTLIVENIYQGLEGVARGTIKYLRVLETKSKVVHTTPQRVDVGMNSGWDMRSVLGTVPVEADGSVHFQVPADRQIFFEALDKDYLEIRRMRNFMSVKRGEVTSCIGCHEPYGSTLGKRDTPPLALQRVASTIEAPPWGADRLGFESVVQPVLRQNCVHCHDGTKGPRKSFNLRGGRMVVAPAGFDRDAGPQHHVSDSYLKLLPYVSYIRVGSYQGEKLPLAPRATGSLQSKLMLLLKTGHHDVNLALADWRALAAWIDCNAPYYGGWDEIVIGRQQGVPGRGTLSTLRQATPTDARRISERRKALSHAGRVVAYLDCGVQLNSGGDEVSITQTRGRGWNYCPAKEVDGLLATQADICFDENQVTFALKGLSLGKKYTLDMTWWDYNTADRKQSIWLVNAKGKRTRLLAPTALPSYHESRKMPGHVSLDLPVNDEGVTIAIQREGGANAVLSEIWVTALQ